MRSVMTLVVVGVAAIGSLQVETPPLETRGMLEIVAPIILEVSEDGKPIGTTKEPKLRLRSGKHVLTLSNRDLGYTSTHRVNIEPGEFKRITVDPRAPARLLATPWAEVWMNGRKLGETPLAHQLLPLGTHEIVFKHPRLGERRVTTTIRANPPTSISVEMWKAELVGQSTTHQKQP